MSNVGFRIGPDIKRDHGDIIEKLRKLPTSAIADVMWRLNSIGGSIRAVYPNGQVMAGPAFTVKVPPGDNLMMHKALELAQPGDVLVVDAGGDVSHAITGEIMCRYAKKKGIAGFVIDGAVRDYAGIKRLNFPVYARGLQPRGPYKNGPGEINVTVSINGTIVHPGDIIVGDDDGLVVVPSRDAEEVCAKAMNKVAAEQATFDQIEQGTMDTDWIDRLLNEKGCEFSVHARDSYRR